MISVKHVSKFYSADQGDLLALDDISFEVAAGEIFGVIGRSGAGKSTLLRCLNLLEQPSSGDVLINGKPLTQMNSQQLLIARRQIGMVFQHFNLLSTKTVFDNVALPLKLAKKEQADIKAKVADMLALVGLEDKAASYPSQLSGGQKQRVAIARALVTEPTVLLCDEMTSALDPETTSAILQLVKDIQSKLNLSIVMITHEMDVIKQVADKVMVLEHGRMLEQGAVIDIFKRPQHAVTQSLIRSTLKLDLPDCLANKMIAKPQLGWHPIVRMTFVGQVAEEPIVSELTQRFGVKVNILQANLELLQGEMLGMMVVSLVTSDAKALDNALSYLELQHVDSEVIGYLDEV